jgi:hypothetical protein
MQNTEKRIAVLEQANPDGDRITAIVHHVVRPGHLDADIDYIRDGAGREWRLLPGEDERALTDRALSETERNKSGMAWLIADNMELCHANN